MKMSKAKAITLFAVASSLAFSPAASARGLYQNMPGFCKSLNDNWTGSASNWLDWIAFCA